jgi:polar amino acid transport system substrate-binding protein
VSKGAQTGDYEGLTIDLGRALAKRLGVPFAAVPFTDLDKMSACVANGECDAMVIATDASIAKDFALTSPFVEFDNSYLVARNSPIRTVDDVDRWGTRVAVYTGSAVHLHLKERLKQAELRTTTRGPERVEWLRSGQVDSLADGVQTLRVLFMPQLPGSRIVDGHFSTTTLVLGVAPSRRVGVAFLTGVIEDMKRSGEISESISRWSLSARVPGAGR